MEPSKHKRMSGKKMRAEQNRISQRPHALLEVMRRNEYHPRDTCVCNLTTDSDTSERVWITSPGCPLHGF